MQTKQQLIDQAIEKLEQFKKEPDFPSKRVGWLVPYINTQYNVMEDLLTQIVESAYDKGREDAASDFKAHLIRSDLTAAEVVTLTPEKYRA